MAYSLPEQLTAVEIFQQSGEAKLTEPVLNEIRATLGSRVGRPTVLRWIKTLSGADNKNNVIDTQNVIDKKNDNIPAIQRVVSYKLAEQCEQVAGAYMAHALQPKVIAATSGPQAMTAAGIAIDKRHKLLGLPGEVLTILVQVVDQLNARGISPGDTFQAMLQELVAHGSDPDGH